MNIDEIIREVEEQIHDYSNQSGTASFFSVELLIDGNELFRELVRFRSALSVAMDALFKMSYMGAIRETKKEADSGN